MVRRGRRRDPQNLGQPRSYRFPAEMEDDLDAEVARLNELTPRIRHTASDVLRLWWRKAIRHRGDEERARMLEEIKALREQLATAQESSSRLERLVQRQEEAEAKADRVTSQRLERVVTTLKGNPDLRFHLHELVSAEVQGLRQEARVEDLRFAKQELGSYGVVLARVQATEVVA